jgi:NAD(P)-dependent dehydrogenase (short-subunit alcohol dehydrogenase family)
MDHRTKVAVVTGASRGIGKQTSILLARHGYQLVLAARTEEPRAGTPGTLGETAAALRTLGADPLEVRADLSVPADVDHLVTTTLERFGKIDALVNNAAYTVGKALFAHVPDITRQQWDRSFAVNVTAPLMLVQGFWESMRAEGGGVIVNVTSGAADFQPVAAARAARAGLPEHGPAYGASKAALNRMMNAIAQQGVEHRIAVINVEPGFVLTETMAATLAGSGVTDTDAISPTIPALAVAHLCTCADPLRYTGRIISGPALVEELGLVPPGAG